jgi:integrase
MLCSSGLRLGELGSLRVCDIQFGAEDEPAKVTLKAAKTKSRKSRITFMTAEAAGLLKEYLGERNQASDSLRVLLTRHNRLSHKHGIIPYSWDFFK